MEKTDTTITWTAGNGAEIKIIIGDYLDRVVANLWVDDKRQGSYALHMLRAPVIKNGNVVVARIGNVGLTQAHLDRVRAISAVVQAEIDARPDVQMGKLIADRKRLASKIGFILAEEHEVYTRYIEEMSANGFSRRPDHDYTADEQAARAALADFDRAHPDVIVKIKSDRDAANDHFFAVD